MAETDLEALEAKLVALRDIVREAEAPTPAASGEGVRRAALLASLF